MAQTGKTGWCPDFMVNFKCPVRAWCNLVIHGNNVFCSYCENLIDIFRT